MLQFFSLSDLKWVVHHVVFSLKISKNFAAVLTLPILTLPKVYHGEVIRNLHLVCVRACMCVGESAWVTFTLQNLVFSPRLQMTSCKRSRILMKTLIMAWDISHYIRCNAASSSWRFVGGFSKLRTLLPIMFHTCSMGFKSIIKIVSISLWTKLYRACPRVWRWNINTRKNLVTLSPPGMTAIRYVKEILRLHVIPMRHRVGRNFILM